MNLLGSRPVHVARRVEAECGGLPEKALCPTEPRKSAARFAAFEVGDGSVKSLLADNQAHIDGATI
jgi:hypothetical protein